MPLIRSETQAKALNDKAMPAYEEAKAKAEAALSAATQAEEAAAAACFQDQASERRGEGKDSRLACSR